MLIEAINRSPSSSLFDYYFVPQSENHPDPVYVLMLKIIESLDFAITKEVEFEPSFSQGDFIKNWNAATWCEKRQNKDNNPIELARDGNCSGLVLTFFSYYFSGELNFFLSAIDHIAHKDVDSESYSTYKELVHRVQESQEKDSRILKNMEKPWEIAGKIKAFAKAEGFGVIQKRSDIQKLIDEMSTDAAVYIAYNQHAYGILKQKDGKIIIFEPNNFRQSHQYYESSEAANQFIKQVNLRLYKEKVARIQNNSNILWPLLKQQYVFENDILESNNQTILPIRFRYLKFESVRPVTSCQCIDYIDYDSVQQMTDSAYKSLLEEIFVHDHADLLAALLKNRKISDQHLSHFFEMICLRSFKEMGIMNGYKEPKCLKFLITQYPQLIRENASANLFNLIETDCFLEFLVNTKGFLLQYPFFKQFFSNLVQGAGEHVLLPLLEQVILSDQVDILTEIFALRKISFPGWMFFKTLDKNMNTSIFTFAYGVKKNKCIQFLIDYFPEACKDRPPNVYKDFGELAIKQILIGLASSWDTQFLDNFLEKKIFDFDNFSLDKTEILHHFISEQRCDHVAILLKRGADVNKKSSKGFTCKIPDLNFQQCVEATPLHFAINMQNKALVELLLLHEANINEPAVYIGTDGHKQTFSPIEIAERSKQYEIADLLKQAQYKSLQSDQAIAKTCDLGKDSVNKEKIIVSDKQHSTFFAEQNNRFSNEPMPTPNLTRS